MTMKEEEARALLNGLLKMENMTPGLRLYFERLERILDASPGKAPSVVRTINRLIHAADAALRGDEKAREFLDKVEAVASEVYGDDEQLLKQ